MKRDRLISIVIREELVMLTKHRDEALILNQFVYWTSRTKDYNAFLQEESLNKINENHEYKNGWIYKSADELKEELLMIDTNVKTIRKYLNSLVSKGYLLRRTNPLYKFDKTYQYRINLKKLVEELNKLGHDLVNFEQFSKDKSINKLFLSSEITGVVVTEALTNNHLLNVEEDILDSPHDKVPFPEGHLTAAIPEIISEVTFKENTSEIISLNEEVEVRAFNEIKQLYFQLSSKITLTSNDKEAIHQVLKLGLELSEILNMMYMCSNEQKISDKSPKIWSFNYFLNYILKEVKYKSKKSKLIQPSTKKKQVSIVPDFLQDTISNF